MAKNGAKWTAVNGSRIRFLEGGRRNGPDMLFVPLRTGLAAEEVVWSATTTVGRAVALDAPEDWPPGAVAALLVDAIEVFRLRHPHLVASGALCTAAATAANSHPGAFESLILAGDGNETDLAQWAGALALLPVLTLPTLTITALRLNTALQIGAKLPGCRLLTLDSEAPWPGCAHAVCTWIDGGYRSVPLAPGSS